jgi:hypothetical protein
MPYTSVEMFLVKSRYDSEPISLSLSLVYLFFDSELVQDSTRNFSAYVLDLLKLASLAISSNSLQQHLDWVAALDFELVSQA